MKSKIALTTLFTLSAFLFIPQAGSRFTNIMPPASAQLSMLNASRCNNSILKGTYVVNLTGWVNNDSERVPYALVANVVADGQGLVAGTGTASLDGVISPLDITATYTVNPDCTGIGISEQVGSYKFVISPDGSKAINISDVPTTTVTGTSERISR